MKISKLSAVVATILILVSILSACSLLGGRSDLAGTTWQLSSLGKDPLVTGSSITLSFDKDTLGGSGGCNSYGGEYKLRGDKLTISSVYSTEMYCEAAGLMDQEGVYYQMLSQVTGLSAQEDVLTLTTDDGGTLVFQRVANLPD